MKKRVEYSSENIEGIKKYETESSSQSNDVYNALMSLFVKVISSIMSVWLVAINVCALQKKKKFLYNIAKDFAALHKLKKLDAL